MDNHFRYEERHLLAALDLLVLDVVPRVELGPSCDATRLSRNYP